jgi:uncharacterized protein YqhQ
VHGPTHWAAAVRTKAGDIKVASGPKPRVTIADDIPGVRGLFRLGEAFAVIPLVKKGLPEAKMAFEQPSVIGVAAVASIAGTLLRRRAPGVTGEVASSFIALAPALFALRGGELAAYHGVEHKAIAAYEQGIEDPASVPKEHDRCGSNLVVPMMLLSAGGTVLLERLVESPGPLARAGVGIGGASLAVEMFAWSDRHHGAPLAEAFHTPGREIQRHLATKEPTAEQLEVGIAALAEILRAEGA